MEDINDTTEIENITLYIAIRSISLLTDKSTVSIVVYCSEYPNKTISNIYKSKSYTYQKAEIEGIKLAIDKFDDMNKNITIHSTSSYVKSIIVKYGYIVSNGKENEIESISCSNSDIVKYILYSLTNRSIESSWINIKIITTDNIEILRAKKIAYNILVQHKT